VIQREQATVIGPARAATSAEGDTN